MKAVKGKFCLGVVVFLLISIIRAATVVLAFTDPVGAWTSVRTLPRQTANHPSFVINGNLFVLGGAIPLGSPAAKHHRPG